VARLGTILGLLLLAVGCGTDVAQTAYRPSGRAPLDCRPATGNVTLPTDPALGGGDTRSSSPLLGGTYGPGQGPGISLVALDGFRLYQNGEFVAESTASLVPTFVPITFLPGENVITVIVSAPERAPAVLVHVDELERPYLSDASWKVSTAPVGDFRAPGYDDSGWETARDHGLAVATAGCEPPAGFVAGSLAHWIGTRDESARTAVFRLAFRIAPVGFGAATTGGEGAEPVVASDLDEFAALLESDTPAVILVPEGPLNLRRPPEDAETEQACPLPCDDGSGQTTYFALSGTQTCDEPLVPIVRDERHLAVGSNKTLVGLGRGALLEGAWLSTEGSENVIVRNVAIYGVNPSIIEAGDGFGIGTSSRVWLDHLTFRWIGDGFVDVSSSTGITLSWIRFDGRNEQACLGHHPRANELGASSATIHHCFYDHVTGRAPLANLPGSRIHLFNVVVRDNPDYAVGAGCSAEILLEGSHFEDVGFPTVRRDCSGDASLGKIYVRPDSNSYVATGPHRLSGADSAEPRDAVLPLLYDYELDPVGDARQTVPRRAGAGSHWAQPFELTP
jgi:pectate lyase